MSKEITLTDYFVGQVIQGLLAGPKGDLFSKQKEEAATLAYQIADALLAIREKRPT